MYSKVIILAALAASTSAHATALLPRQTADLADPEETASSSPECTSRIESWSAAFPTPAPALVDALEEDGLGASGLEGLCEFAKGLPKAQASAYTSYNVEMYSYLSAQSSNLVMIATSCSADMGAPPSVITSQLEELLTVYSSFSAGACGVLAEATTTDDAATTSSGSRTSVRIASATSSSESSTTLATTTTSATSSAAISSGSGASATNTESGASAAATVSENAGPKETGVFAAAALVVGFVGAAVAL
ncbi:hypothetical protein AAE478_005994 [Parahypoxylon ruwenzoriense]